LRAGTWNLPVIASRVRNPAGRTLAILGLGGIGLRLAELAHALPMRIIYHSRHKAKNAPPWCEYFADVEDMLGQTDVLSIHIPLTADTHGLVGEKWIRSLKKGAIIINTARGKLIDENAMIKALEDGHVHLSLSAFSSKHNLIVCHCKISSIGLDVYPNEPDVNPRLLEFDQVTLLPHMGTEDQDTQHKMEIRALTNLRDFLTKGQGMDLIPEMRS
jgi:glyoxylate reductase